MKTMLGILLICSLAPMYAMEHSYRVHRVIPVSDIGIDASALIEAMLNNGKGISAILSKYNTSNIDALLDYKVEKIGKTPREVFIEKNKKDPMEFVGRFIKRTQGFNAEDDELHYQEQIKQHDQQQK